MNLIPYGFSALTLATIAALPPQPPLVKNRPDGVLIWYAQDYIDLTRWPDTAPVFAPAHHATRDVEAVFPGCCWYWSGALNDPAATPETCATRLLLDPGDTLTLRMMVDAGGGMGVIYAVIDAWPFRPADWDRDGDVDSSDVSAYLADWLAPMQDTEQPGDYDGDGDADSSDLSAFLVAWEGAL